MNNYEQVSKHLKNELLQYLESRRKENPNPLKPEKVVSDYLKRERMPLITNKLIPVTIYKPDKDHIIVPNRGLYKSNNDYLRELFVDIIHSTGHPDRLHRFSVRSSIYNSPFEGLVTTMGTLFLCTDTGLRPDLSVSISYIEGMIPHLKGYPDCVPVAVTKAIQAVEFVKKGGAR